MLNRSFSYFWHHTSRLAHVGIVSALLAVIVLGGGILTLRYWLLPDVMRYHAEIETLVSQAIGQPVRLGEIEADWDGFHPRLQVDDVQVLDLHGQPGLALERVGVTVSWRSLLGGVQLSRLELNEPNLIVRRDAQGHFNVAGVALKPSSGDNGLADWLLQQHEIFIRRARISWFDEQRGADPLHLKSVELRIENEGKRHRFALRAEPPASLSAPLDVRGDFYGKDAAVLTDWQGQAFVQIDHTDVTAWRPWLDLPPALSRGHGGLRLWLGLEQGALNSLRADLALSDVSGQLDASVPELALSRVQGRFSWRAQAGELEVATRQLSLHLAQGLQLPPTDFLLHLKPARAKQAASGELRANHLDLASLHRLAEFFPLKAAQRQQLADWAPHGEVGDLVVSWRGTIEAPSQFRVAGRMQHFGVQASGEWPGVSDLSGEIDGSDQSGTLALHADHLVFNAPRWFAEPLNLTQFHSQLRWTHPKTGWQFELVHADLASADGSGSLSGRYQTGMADKLDLTAEIARLDLRALARYLPTTAVDAETRDWLASALQAGVAEQGRIHFSGNPQAFPFRDKQQGVFEIQTQAKNVQLQYAPGWPQVTVAACHFHLDGQRIEVQAGSALTAGIPVQQVSVVLPDTASADLPLDLKLVAQGASSKFFDFIQQTPVRGYLGNVTDGMSASGNGRLELALTLPLQGSKPERLAGSYHFQANDLSLAAGLPVLQKTTGDLLFTESSLRTQNVSTQILGGPAMVAVTTLPSGAVRARLSGVANFDALRGSEPYPLLRDLSGRGNWSGDILALQKRINAVFSSDLRGVESHLPAPFNKSADATLPLRFELQEGVAGQDALTIRLADRVEARLLRQRQGDVMRVQRGSVNFGGAAGKPERDGVWVSGTIPQLGLTGWDRLTGGDSGGDWPWAGVELSVQKTQFGHYSLGEFSLSGSRRGSGLALQLSGADAVGEAVLQPGKVTAHLKMLALHKISYAAPTIEATPAEPVVPTQAEPLPPALDLTVDNLSVQGRGLGRLQLQGQPQGRDWKLERLTLVNPEGDLSVTGGLYPQPNGSEQTRLAVVLQLADAGKILDRSGFPGALKQGGGKLNGQFAWQGGATQFNYATLDGSLQLETGKGQFLKVDPGIGKLLSVLSLQALPKHITLDFNDVFSDGFQFDSISGEARIQHGILRSDNFSIDGSSAKVKMSGEVDLQRETQNLRVKVLPTVGNSVSLLGALAVNPVVGVGAFIANKLLQNPLDKLVSFEYNVSGSWAKPNVSKVGATVAPQPARSFEEN